MGTVLLILFLFLLLLTTSNGRNKDPNFRRKPTLTEDEQIAASPFNQHLPDCKKTHEIEYLEKKTSAKAMACPMFRDEEGFLSEWLAYYKLMGFDHIMMFDDGSIDDSLLELEPWITSGKLHISCQSNFHLLSSCLATSHRRHHFIFMLFHI